MDRLEPDAADYSPITSADDPWHELRVGETVLAIGAVRNIFNPVLPTPGPTCMVPAISVGFRDWTELLVELPHGIPPELYDFRNGGFYMLNFKLRRTEDGFEGIAVWETGGVPIPLTGAAP